MRRLLFIFSILAAAYGCCYSKERISLGYCNGDLESGILDEMKGSGWCSGSVLFPKNTLAAYKGCQISAVNVGLPERLNIDTLRVWIRESLDGSNMAEGIITRSTYPKISKGWNNVSLSLPYTIEDKALYVGYSYKQRADVKGISLVGEGVPGTTFICKGQNAEWIDMSEKGNLCLEAMVEGDIPRCDLGILSAEIYPASTPYVMRVKAMVHNFGLSDIDKVVMENYAGDGKVCEVEVQQNISSAVTASLVYDFPVGDTYSDEWKVGITGDSAKADECGENNAVKATLSYIKNPLIEEFTTENCPNCPPMARLLADVLADVNYKDRVNVIAHHSGFYTDNFTLPSDEELLWLYMSDSGTTYAPAVIFDRTPVFDDPSSLASSNLTADSVRKILERLISGSAPAGLRMEVTCNSDTTALSVKITGMKNGNYISHNPHITVYLVEDHVPARFQKGTYADGTPVMPGYEHSHLTRLVNSTWGDPVDWDGDIFQYETEFVVSPEWNKEHLSVVAHLSNYDSNNRLNCMIVNSVNKKLVEVHKPDAGTANINTEIEELDRFRVDGTRIPAGSLGLQIVRYSDGSVKKEYIRQ